MAIFKRKILPGLSEKIQELKTWCSNTFSLKTHNHDDRYSKVQTQTYVTSRELIDKDDVTWTVTTWSDGFVQLTGRVPCLSRIGTTDDTASLKIDAYRRWVQLPITFDNVNYHIQVTPTTWMGFFSYGSGVCGYAMPLTGATNNAYSSTTGMYNDKFVLLVCNHYESYFIRIEGYLL